ncbi:NADH-ubiquinone oxidoreductase-F iron-sulfur binding region domain-containing protein [Streptomyces sp. P9(2023)]|uniref:NADH-ubiquinone oxidoreductase-F iron-sulfur binding region domain-containing protein n=1 Tax=Streptomyces sp. P9(2023) TaxID=3064394 RepID=UPI0028F44035|nr:NADH-ubiquinone oxidoreductase-F iron-sulfur binding region domain-containing protein [Streptomyces sp. P9(2023)]MDT9693361.1 NADH-ubiquinone oxidoreductase-F iron-sulfur binding region domain-containing protein [Streptomyces sp. P9(2023)]
MDLRFGDGKPSDEEREAVDAVLGPPDSAWDGADDRSAADLRWARGGREARERRDLLLPGLHALNDRVGWISEGGLAYLCRRLTVPPAEAYGVATFYSMFAVRPRPAQVLHVCTDLVCAARGSTRLTEGLVVDGVAFSPSPCLGLCERAPAALLVRAGVDADATAPVASGDRPALGPGASLLGALSGQEPTAAPTLNPVAPGGTARGDGPRTRLARVVAPATVDALAGATVSPEAVPPEANAAMAVPQHAARPVRAGGRVVPTLPQTPSGGTPTALRDDCPQRLLARVGVVDPSSVDDYRAHGGYAALRRAFALGPAGVIREVTDSGLVGRGGAAFPTGRKWQATAAQADGPHYVVCNADESEPGTFKDRVVMEGDPYALVEAMTVAGFAVGAHHGYLYIRGEYPRAYERLDHAIGEARARGLLGDDILGSGFAFDIEIRRGAGAYICGEETALFNSIEGYRGEPRSKPPFPVEKGLFGKPTAANNVETLVNVLPILTLGAEAFRAAETKLFCVSGNVDRPGVYELPFGATLGELLDLAGKPDTLRAVLLGGAAGGFVRPDELDIPLTFEGTRAAGTTLGSGVVLVLDESVDLPRILLRIAEFFRDESCGQCVPCRVGTVRQEEALHRIKDRTGDAAAADIALLREVGQALRDASICGLGQTAWNAVESAIDRLGVYR